jgi:hypothetical protein
MRLMFAWSMLLSCAAGLASYPQGPLIKVEQTWSGPEIALPPKPPKFEPERSPNDNCMPNGEWDRQHDACNSRKMKFL